METSKRFSNFRAASTSAMRVSRRTRSPRRDYCRRERSGRTLARDVHTSHTKTVRRGRRADPSRPGPTVSPPTSTPPFLATTLRPRRTGRGLERRRPPSAAGQFAATVPAKPGCSFSVCSASWNRSASIIRADSASANPVVRRALRHDVFGPRTDAAQVHGRTWWTTSQSQSARTDASGCRPPRGTAHVRWRHEDPREETERPQEHRPTQERTGRRPTRRFGLRGPQSCCSRAISAAMTARMRLISAR